MLNGLETDLYSWSVSATDGPLVKIAANGGQYAELWRPNIGDTGVSIKVSTEPDKESVLQFEYSMCYPTVYWDISCINLASSSRIMQAGFAAVPSDPGYEHVVCKPGAWDCTEVYHEPYDNHAIRSCPVKTSVVLKLGYGIST